MTVRQQFSDEEIKIIQQAATATWQEIGGDALQSIAEAEGKNPEAFTLRRAEVMELSLDANRPDHHLRRATKNWPPEKAADFFKRYRATSYEQLIQIVKPAFPYERYGM